MMQCSAVPARCDDRHLINCNTASCTYILKRKYSPVLWSPKINVTSKELTLVIAQICDTTEVENMQYETTKNGLSTIFPEETPCPACTYLTNPILFLLTA